MALDIPENIRDGNYGMGIVNTAAGLSTGVDLLSKVNRGLNVMPTTFN